VVPSRGCRVVVEERLGSPVAAAPLVTVA
jgi:hypothetical protein